MNADFKVRHIRDDFTNSLLSVELKSLLDIIKKDDTLRLCFRGHSISVYYKGDSLFKIVPLKKCYKIHFDYNHARFTSNFETQRRRLEELGYEYSEGKGDVKKRYRKITHKYPLNNMKSDSCFFWNDSSIILKMLIDDFLDLEKKHDYYKKENKKGKSCHLERQRQQDIMRVNNTLNGEYFVYDIEYDQPRNSSEEAKSGRFDMLALRRKSKGHYNLVIIELKSTIDACIGKCGIEKHRRDLKTYIGKGAIVKIRKDDALKIYEHYSLLGLVEQESVQIEDVEILFVFTDEAIGYANKIQDKKERCVLSSEDLHLKYNEGVS